MTDAQNRVLADALDRFDVPPLSAGLADRIVAATTTPASAPFAAPRRDRRGMWRRGRQVVLGTLAVGLLSAGAVASGFLSSVGIEVPVLTAMLAPKPKPVAKPVRPVPRPPVVQQAIETPPEPIADPSAVGMRPLATVAERMALRQERRERRQAFAAEHPVAAAVIRERVRDQLQRRALARRQALAGPGFDPALPGARPLDLADRAALARAARRDRMVAEKLIDRRLQAREARMEQRQGVRTDGTDGSPAVAPEAPVGPRLPMVSDRTQRPLANDLPQRLQLRDRIQQRRALRAGRFPQNQRPN